MIASNKLLKFLIQSNLVISVSGGVLTFGIAQHFLLNHAVLYGLLVCLLIFSVYTLQRIADKTGFHDVFHEKHNSVAIGLSFIAIFTAIFIGISLFNYSNRIILLTLFFALLCYWYTIPLFGKKLREVPGIKILVTALTWTFACAIFPLLNEKIEFEYIVQFSALIFTYMIAIILPFDIRDVATDDMRQSTIPQLIGIPSTKIIGVLLMVFFIIANVYCKLISPNNWLFFAATISQIILLVLASENRKYYYFGLIDFLIVLLGISYCF